VREEESDGEYRGGGGEGVKGEVGARGGEGVAALCLWSHLIWRVKSSVDIAAPKAGMASTHSLIVCMYVCVRERMYARVYMRERVCVNLCGVLECMFVCIYLYASVCNSTCIKIVF
jgi:hypothetical protein